jgi:hypothetical protein
MEGKRDSDRRTSSGTKMGVLVGSSEVALGWFRPVISVLASGY